ncbi:MAG TPA: DUF2939 domain-containing protein [Acetobacteraceae bacterium]|nr:DUF2939 domain-containing protein [Acetobacteraceae bacterium]
MAARVMVAVVSVLGVTYLTSPYVALYRLGRDVRAGDCTALAADVDWQQVRAGMRAEVAAEQAAAHQANDELPAFGATFVTHIADHVIDRVVTPESMVRAVDATAPARVRPAPDGGIGFEWGFFDGARGFVAWMHTARDRILCVHMRLEGASWRVVRVTMAAPTHHT